MSYYSNMHEKFSLGLFLKKILLFWYQNNPIFSMNEISMQNMHNLFDKTVNWGFAGIVYVQNLRNQQPLNSQSVSIQLYYVYVPFWRRGRLLLGIYGLK